jgi:hypothetical protein
MLAEPGARSKGAKHREPGSLREASTAHPCRRSEDATGRFPKTREMSKEGLVIQSIAFFSTPGTELLCSGVARSRPSEPATRSFNSCTAAGTPSLSSRSPL